MTGGWRKPLQQQQNREYHLILKVYVPSNDNVGKYTTRFCEVKNLLAPLVHYTPFDPLRSRKGCYPPEKRGSLALATIKLI